MESRVNDFTYIPLVDMSDHDEKLMNDLILACENVGFFYLCNHGIKTQLMTDVIKLTKELYKLDQFKKDALSISFSPHYRGYGRLNAEKTQNLPDYKETFDLGLERGIESDMTDKPYMILKGPNQWPSKEDVPEFKAIMLEYISQMQQLGYKLMQYLVTGLKINDDEILDKFDISAMDSYALLRLLHYPSTNTNQLGVGPHIDPGFAWWLTSAKPLRKMDRCTT